MSTKFKLVVFVSDLSLSHRSHLRSFAEPIDDPVDQSGEVADLLDIYTI